METLILSSKGPILFDFLLDKYLPKKWNECKIAYIVTASKKSFNGDHIIEMKQKMDEQMLNYNEIDIAEINKEELENTLSKFDIIMVDGGNTYYLLKCIRESGFDKIVKKLLKKGIVYIGVSSGAYVASPSIVTATWSNRGFDTFDIEEYSAMSLVDFLIKAHYTPEKFEFFKEKSKESKFPLCLLSDSQALIVKDGNIKSFGKEEIIFLGQKIL